MPARRFSRLTAHRPRYADVAATLALVFAMSGTAYAVVTTVPANSVNTAAIQNKAVTTPKIASEAVSNDKIAPAAVTGGKIATGAVSGGKVAANAITGGKVKNHSLTLADLAGSSLVGPISFTFAAHGCGNLILAVPGARVGQMAVFNWVGTSNPPAGIMVGPLKVVATGRVITSACNLTGHTITGNKVKVRVTTLS